MAAEGRLTAVRHWIGEVRHAVIEYRGRTEGLATALESDLPQAASAPRPFAGPRGRLPQRGRADVDRAAHRGRQPKRPPCSGRGARIGHR